MTLGACAKFHFDTWELTGLRELRAIVTYDVIKCKKCTLVAGSDVIGFVDQSPKLALKLGASLTFALVKRLQSQFNYDYEVRKTYSDHIGVEV